MNTRLIEMLEKIDSIPRNKLTVEQNQLLNSLEYWVQMRLLESMDNRIQEKDDAFWTDLGKTFLGI